MSLPIAANLPSGMFTPIAVLIAGYAILSIIAGRARSNDDRPRAERFSNLAFGLVLVSALYALVLLIASVVSYPSRFYDMVVIIVVIGVFFALLLFVFFLLAEVLPRVLRRGGDR
jgi:small neutral amino acid transporter SnatA (MarC family)